MAKVVRIALVGDFDPAVTAHRAIPEALRLSAQRLEAEIEEVAQGPFPTELAVLQTTPGVGAVLSLTILLEIDTIDRFDTRQQFCSYARLCGAVPESAGQRTGLGNRKAGNAWLKWAFSEAAVVKKERSHAA
jgi:transposase